MPIRGSKYKKLYVVRNDLRLHTVHDDKRPKLAHNNECILGLFMSKMSTIKHNQIQKRNLDFIKIFYKKCHEIRGMKKARDGDRIRNGS